MPYLRTPEEKEQEVNDILYREWPWGTQLPVKKMAEDHRPPQLGFLLKRELNEGEVTVHLHNLFSALPADQIETITYDTVEDLVNDGWVVD